jgi:hypothetical protein
MIISLGYWACQFYSSLACLICVTCMDNARVSCINVAILGFNFCFQMSDGW